MNSSTETREILRNYKAMINARRRGRGQKPPTTPRHCGENWGILVENKGGVPVGVVHLSGGEGRGKEGGGGGG
ncbi:hypothetical protein, partial [Escherichia coli]|uniref:hypothetical protein n=1 Tax=Escherichia coli TaxID=562 RepID=UPI001BAF3922